MYPAPFDYYRPDSLQQTIRVLRYYGDRARLLAGGQSLIPMMKLRLGEQDALVDIGRLPDLADIRRDGNVLHIGALATHADIAASEAAACIPAVVDVAAGIADRQVRSLGTIGGGLSVADPSGDWPTCLRGLRASVELTGAGGTRRVPVSEFVTGAYTTCIDTDEILTAVHVPVPVGVSGSAYVAFKRAASAFPTCSAGVQLTVSDDSCELASLVLGCAGPVAVISADAEARLRGQPVNRQNLEAAAEIIVAESAPPADARGSEAFKRAMLKTLVVEAGERALARARGKP